MYQLIERSVGKPGIWMIAKKVPAKLLAHQFAVSEHQRGRALSAKERLRWVTAMPNDAMEWAARQDKKGLPDTKVMTSYLAELRRLNVVMLREWDK